MFKQDKQIQQTIFASDKQTVFFGALQTLRNTFWDCSVFQTQNNSFKHSPVLIVIVWNKCSDGFLNRNKTLRCCLKIVCLIWACWDMGKTHCNSQYSLYLQLSLFRKHLWNFCEKCLWNFFFIAKFYEICYEFFIESLNESWCIQSRKYLR